VLAVVAYIVPLVLAGLLLTAPRRRSPGLIGGVLAVLPVFYAVQFSLLQELGGWPTGTPLPDQFELLAYSVEEPDRTRDIEGQILLWLRPQGAREPRAHRLGYDRTLHQSLSEAGQRLAEGRRQVGERERPDGQAQRREGDGTGPAVVFREMPRRGLPPKPARPSE
jgi:hypothetical protein